MEGTSTKQTEPEVVEITLTVPELRTRSVIGGGCCAVSADFLIQEALRELEQVRDVSIFEDQGLVQVRATDDGARLREEIMERIESLGLTALISD